MVVRRILPESSLPIIVAGAVRSPTLRGGFRLSCGIEAYGDDYVAGQIEAFGRCWGADFTPEPRTSERGLVIDRRNAELTSRPLTPNEAESILAMP